MARPNEDEKQFAVVPFTAVTQRSAHQMAELYRRKVATMTNLLQDSETKDEAFEIIRSMIDEVCLVPQGGKLRIDLRGERTDILSLCQERKSPAITTRLMQSILRWLRG